MTFQPTDAALFVGLDRVHKRYLQRFAPYSMLDDMQSALLQIGGDTVLVMEPLLRGVHGGEQYEPSELDDFILVEVHRFTRLIMPTDAADKKPGTWMQMPLPELGSPPGDTLNSYQSMDPPGREEHDHDEDDD